MDSDTSNQNARFDETRLKEMAKHCITKTIDSIAGVKITPEFETEWKDYCMMWNALRDNGHAQYMGEDIRGLLKMYYPSWTYEINCLKRQDCICSFVDAVNELEDKIRGYWENGYVK